MRSKRKKILGYLLGFSILFILSAAFGSYQLSEEQMTLAIIAYSMALICAFGQILCIALLSRASRNLSE